MKMNLTELAKKETELYSIVTSLGPNLKEREDLLEKLDVFKEYCFIHQSYAELQSSELEALKRGVFLTWYAAIESPAVTGLRDLDELAEHEIIESLDLRIKKNKLDYELEWMLSYYATWDDAFTRFKNFEHLHKKLKSQPVEMPKHLDHNSMCKRGQMGLYWNFISRMG